MLSIPDTIQKKRDKLELSQKDIEFFVQQVVNNGADDAQVGKILFFSRFLLTRTNT